MKLVELVDSKVDFFEKCKLRYYRNFCLYFNLIRYVPIFLSFIVLSNVLVSIIFSLIWFFITCFLDYRNIRNFRDDLRIWFGVPGSGKTTMAAYITKHCINSKIPVCSNVPLSGALKLEASDLGKYDMSFEGVGCRVVYDESSIDFDNRNFKLFAKTSAPQYFALHRHQYNGIDIFSQGIDIDKRIRDRCSGGMFQLYRLNIPGIVCYRAVDKIFFIKKDDKQYIDGFKYKGIPRIIFTRNLWYMFDTHDDTLCPKEQKVWDKW